jgi:Arc/MetJ-type ribon-helix-helix transcriptional regulator
MGESNQLKRVLSVHVDDPLDQRIEAARSRLSRSGEIPSRAAVVRAALREGLGRVGLDDDEDDA